MRIDYEKRPVLLTSRIKDMARCTCGKMFGVKKKTCPSCGEVFDKEFAACFENRTNKISYFNLGTGMFINEDSIKISLLMSSLRYENYKLYVSEDCYRLCIKYNIKTRMSYLYEQPITIKGANCSKREFKFNFMNITQPALDWYYDVKLPTQLIDDFFNALGLENDMQDKRLSIYDLAWVNRIQEKTSTCLREKEYYKKIRFEYDSAKNTLRYTKKELNILEGKNENEIKNIGFTNDLIAFSEESIQTRHERLKKDLKEDELRYKKARYYYNKTRRCYKTLRWDDAFLKERFYYYCDLENIKTDTIEEKYLKYYFQYPKALASHETIHQLFKNQDIIKNAISSKQVNQLNFGVKEKDIESIYEVFKTEKRVFDKLRASNSASGNYGYLIKDTAAMIKRLYDLGVTNFKTKGKLRDLHDSATRALRRYESAKYQFPAVESFNDYNENNYTIKQALDSNTLWDIGDDMNICVGGYGEYCDKYGSVIAYILDKKERFVGCLEFKLIENNYVLVQAKSFSNNLLKKSLQELVVNFCKKRGHQINTWDIKIEKSNHTLIKKENLGDIEEWDDAYMPF